jgi:hypothetical protein
MTKGYTGPKDAPGVREHYYPCSLETLRENFEKTHIWFTNDIYSKSEWEINQFLRGIHNAWIDFLMTQTYTCVAEITEVYHYFQRHLDLMCKYFRDMLEC